MESATVVLNSCAEVRSHPRIDRTNSEPRRIATVATDDRGERAIERAIQDAGVSLFRLPPEALSGKLDALGERPDLIVVAGSVSGNVGHLPAVYELAGKLGVLVTAVVLAHENHPETGDAVDGMRRNSDMLVQTTDNDFLALMLHWLERPS